MYRCVACDAPAQTVCACWYGEDEPRLYNKAPEKLNIASGEDVVIFEQEEEFADV